MKKYRIIVIIFVCILYFAISSNMALKTTSVFISEDEHIYHFYSNLYAKTGQIYYEEPLNLIANNLIHPYGTVVLDNKVSPRGFLGLIPIYGFLSSATSIPIRLITPILGVIGILFFYLLVKMIFGEKQALISAFLLAFFPPYIYHSSLSMENNISALVFFIAGFRYYFKSFEEIKKRNFIISAIFFGVSATIRYEYIYMVGILLLILCIFRYNNVNKKFDVAICLSLFCLIFSLMFSYILFLNNKLYGTFSSTGDSAYISQNLVFFSELNMLQDYSKFVHYIFPSGIHLNLSLINFNMFFVKLVPIYVALAIFGLIFIEVTRPRTKEFNYVLISFILCLYLLVYFGSSDSYYGFDTLTLRSSYVRYFLPAYIFLLPLVSHAMINIHKKLSIPCRHIILMILLVFIVVSSSNNFLPQLESVSKYTVTLSSRATNIQDLTDGESIVFTPHSKYIFPNRKVASYDEKLIPINVVSNAMINLSKNNITVYLFSVDEMADQLNKNLAIQNYKLLSPPQNFEYYSNDNNIVTHTSLYVLEYYGNRR